MADRLPLTQATKNFLWSESGGYCQNPGCRADLHALASETTVAELAHIIPASPRGPRSAEGVGATREDRADPSNILVLCPTCHTLIDKAPTSYPAAVLREWKTSSQLARAAAFTTPLASDRAAARAYVAPILADNASVFRLYGPREEEYDDDRADQWRRHVLGRIIPNNRRLVNFLDMNAELLTPTEAIFVADFKVHASEFEDRHLLENWNPGATRFPPGMSDRFRRPAMTLRDWAQRTLERDRFASTSTGANGLLVQRQDGSQSVVFVAESSGRPFGVPELESAIQELPNCEVVLIIRRPISAGTFEAAMSKGVLLEGFGGLTRALAMDGPVLNYQHPDEVYLRNRLRPRPQVTGVIRIGLKAWRVERRGDLRDLTIVTHDRYEFTDDEMWQLLADYPGLKPDAFVITNPNARGFGTRVSTSAAGAGITLLYLDQFLERLGSSWM